MVNIVRALQTLSPWAIVQTRSGLAVAWAVWGLVVAASPLTVQAQPAATDQPATAAPEPLGPLPVANPGDQVVLKRDPAEVIDPQTYRVPLFLEPYTTVPLVAPADSVVRQIPIKLGAAVQSQTEVVRLDNATARLEVTRAQAELKIATLEQANAAQRGTATDADRIANEITKARLESAKAAVELAELLYQRLSVRTPISGVVERVLVTEGQFVRAGDVLVVVSDLSRLKVEIPAERSSLQLGKPFPIKVESTDVDSRLDAVLPLGSRFEPLRDMYESVASAVVTVENGDGRFKHGQTVYVPIIPRQPVVELRSSAVQNGEEGDRKVQVVRNNQVRDVPVKLLAGVGEDRTFVSGPFRAGDEIVYESSHQLNDGFQLAPAVAPAAGAAGAAAAPATEGAGF